MLSISGEFKKNLGYYFSTVLNKPLIHPHWVFFSLSHQCNYNCQMCGVKNILRDFELDLDILKKSLDEVAAWGTDPTVLFTGGEVFLRKDIFDIIGYSVSLGLTTEVVSNGSLINNADIAARIMDSGLSNIAISLDGATPQTHDGIRGVPGAFARAMEAFALLARAKKAKGRGPQISAWTTMMKENLNELFDIVNVAKEAGVECLVYHPVIVTQEDMQNTIKGGHLWITPELLEVFKQQIDKISDYREKFGLVALLHDPYQWLGYFKGSLTRQDWKCNPFVFVDIGPDGLVRSCGASFGNIRQMSLTDCLYTEQARLARDKMAICDKPCLQTCWAKPEADSLNSAVEHFISSVDNLALTSKEQEEALTEGLRTLDHYENLILKEK